MQRVAVCNTWNCLCIDYPLMKYIVKKASFFPITTANGSVIQADVTLDISRATAMKVRLNKI